MPHIHAIIHLAGLVMGTLLLTTNTDHKLVLVFFTFSVDVNLLIYKSYNLLWRHVVISGDILNGLMEECTQLVKWSPAKRHHLTKTRFLFSGIRNQGTFITKIWQTYKESDLAFGA